MFASQHRLEERAIFGGDEVESRVTFPVIDTGPAQVIQFGDHFAFRLCLGESIKIIQAYAGSG